MRHKSFLLSLFSLLIVGSGLVTGVAMAAPTQGNHSVNIDVNPEGAPMVSTHQRDARLNALRVQKNQQAAQQASAHNKSFVSAAPDPHDPHYWKNKNGGQPHAQDQAGENSNNFVNAQQLQRQTSALQQMLSNLKSNRVRDNKVSVVAFTLPTERKEKNTRAKVGQGAFQSARALPGTVWYATMDSGADSYVPGPVTAEIQEGPFAGGKAVGKFQVAPDGEHLILTFNTVSCAGQSYSVSAVAMDPQTKISGVTGDIDHHIFTRFIIPGAAGFLEAVTQALMNQNQSIVTNPSGIVVTGPHLTNTQLALMGAGGATKSFASATRPEGVLRLPEVKIASGQGIGFLVLKPIV